MKKAVVLSILFLLIGTIHATAQDSAVKSKALNFPAKKYGISIGNSAEFNGIRINFADRNVKKINGLNITFWMKMEQNQEAIVNGASIGVIPVARTMQPLNIGLLGIGSSPGNSNGLTVGGLRGGNINGLAVSGLITMADSDSSVISGVALSGLGIGAKYAINGLAIAGLGLGTEGKINGMAASLIWINGGINLNGIAITAGYLSSDTLKGLSIAGYSKTAYTKGATIAVYNRTKELHGLQFGLLNYAGNNPKGLRVLPLLNLHLRS